MYYLINLTKISIPQLPFLLVVWLMDVKWCLLTGCWTIGTPWRRLNTLSTLPGVSSARKSTLNGGKRNMASQQRQHTNCGSTPSLCCELFVNTYIYIDNYVLQGNSQEPSIYSNSFKLINCKIMTKYLLLASGNRIDLLGLIQYFDKHISDKAQS